MTFEANLDPELAAALPAMETMGLRDLTLQTIPLVREKFAATMRAIASNLPAPPDDVIVQDRHVPGPPEAPDVHLRIYRPKSDGTKTRAALYWMHGGGMILGSVDQEDRVCRVMARDLDCVIVSVDYRLAPEHPYPAPVEDCYAGLVWTAANANELGIDEARLVIGGQSAGGGLAAAVTLLARDRKGPVIAFQCLVYPMLDDRNETASSREFTDLPTFPRAASITGWTALLGAERGSANVLPYAAPARATDLTRLPPAFIQVGELEVFRDEDIAYATRLLQSGVSVELHVYPGAYHGCDRAVPQAGVSQRMNADRKGALLRALHRR